MGSKYTKNGFAAGARPVFRAHGTCLLAANVVLPRLRDNAFQINYRSLICGSLRGGEREGKGKQGKQNGKGRKKRETRPPLK